MNLEDVKINHIPVESQVVDSNKCEEPTQEQLSPKTHEDEKYIMKWTKFLRDRLIQFLGHFLPPTVMMTLQVLKI